MPGPSLKIKVTGGNARKASAKQSVPPTSRKKRRVDSDDDYGDEKSGPESEQGDGGDEDIMALAQGSRRPTMNRDQAPDPDRLFEDDANVDVVINDDGPARAPTPSFNLSPSKKRGKKKAVVFSDEDEEYVQSQRNHDDKDDDFIVEKPKKTGKKIGAGPGKGRGKATKEKGGGIGEIMIKDERKTVPQAATVPAAPVGGEVKTGIKRRRETVSEPKADDAKADEVAIAAPTTSGSVPGKTPEGAPTQPLPKMRKLPPIKKNKTLAGVVSTAPSSGPSTPSASTAAVKAGADAPVGGLPLHTSLPRKPVQKTSDLDLSSPDIYNSLFKVGSSSAPRVGVNSRLKEEERRKELMKMRDEARAARMAQLQQNSFDLLAGQDKIARFEARLRERNSAALYPNHLGSALKLIQAKRNSGLLPPGMYQGSGGCG